MITTLITLVALVLNAAVYTLAGITKMDSLFLFMILIYAAPLLIDIVILYFNSVKNLKAKKLTLILPSITFLAYLVFGNVMMNSSSWIEFVHKNTYETADMFSKIAGNLLSAPQLIFVLILNFALVYLAQRIITSLKK